MVEVGAAGNWKLGKQLWQAINFLKGVNQLGLLPITQDLQIDAQVFLGVRWPSSGDHARVVTGGHHAGGLQAVARALHV